MLQPGLELKDNMICGNDSNVCSLSIQQFEGYKHEGNWTCQLKVSFFCWQTWGVPKAGTCQDMEK